MIGTLHILIFIIVCIKLYCCMPPGFAFAGDCLSSSNCSFGQCCRIGMNRYSFPVCYSLGQEGQTCRMDNEPEKRILSYPDGSEVEVEDVYTQYCPCDVGLVCKFNICFNETVNATEDSPGYLDHLIFGTDDQDDIYKHYDSEDFHHNYEKNYL